MPSTYPISANNDFKKSDLKLIWKLARKDLEKRLGKSVMRRWFAKLKLLEVSAEQVVLTVPGGMYSIWIDENFKDDLHSSLLNYIVGFDRIGYVVREEEETLKKPKKKGKKKTPKGKKSKGKKNKKVPKPALSEEELSALGLKCGLIDTHRFENFVVGESSEFAHAAARAVADSPGRRYQPLYFHSDSGMGKTHLLNAIGWETLRQRPDTKVVYVAAEKFANDYINALQANQLNEFRDRYRKADLLLIDDVYFLERKEGMQREFFHTFTSLSDRQKQIVLASDRPAHEISQLEDRLLTRFQSGLTAEIHRPGMSTRAAILRRKRNDWDLNVSDECINKIVEMMHGCVRKLEGALIQVATVSSLQGIELDPLKVEEILSEVIDESDSKLLTMEEIKEIVAEHYGVTVNQINGKKRTARIAEARLVAMFLIRDLTEHSQVEVGASFGKDHTSVIYAVKRIRVKMESSEQLKNTVELLRRRLKGGRSIQGRRPISNDEPHIPGRPEGDGQNQANSSKSGSSPGSSPDAESADSDHADLNLDDFLE